MLMIVVRSNIWVADAARIGNRFKWRLYDDTGLLTAESGTVRFDGKRSQVVCSQVIRINLICQPFPWLTILLAAAVLIALPFSSLTSYFTWQNPATIPLIAGIIIFTIVVAGLVQWVEVEYSDEQGDSQKVFFLDGSGWGYARLFGATGRLHRALQDAVFPPGN